MSNNTSDIRIDTGFSNHWKRKLLQKRLGAEGVLALYDLWCFAGANKPEGILSGMSDEAVEAAANWNGPDRFFVATCLELVFLDRLPDGTLIIHDWKDHNPYAADYKWRQERAKKANAARYGREYHPTESQNVAPATQNASSTLVECYKHPPSPSPSPNPVVCGPLKTEVVKTTSAHAREDSPAEQPTHTPNKPKKSKPKSTAAEGQREMRLMADILRSQKPEKTVSREAPEDTTAHRGNREAPQRLDAAPQEPDRDWAAIRADYEGGATLAALSQYYGCSRRAIRKRSRTERWAKPTPLLPTQAKASAPAEPTPPAPAQPTPPTPPQAGKALGNDQDRSRSPTDKPTTLNRTPRTASPTRIPDDFDTTEHVRSYAEAQGIEREALAQHVACFTRRSRYRGYECCDWDEFLIEAIEANWAKLPNGGRSARAVPNGTMPPSAENTAARSAVRASQERVEQSVHGRRWIDRLTAQELEELRTKGRVFVSAHGVLNAYEVPKLVHTASGAPSTPTAERPRQRVASE